MARVSTRSLRYYDELGLLRPAAVDEATGYRYYAARQIAELNRIVVLKELGFRLSEIAEVMSAALSPAELRGMLELRRAEAQSRLQEEARRLDQIETRLAQVDEQGGLAHMDVVVRAEPERLLFGTRIQASSFEDASAHLGRVMSIVRQEVDTRRLGQLVVVAHGDAFDPDALDLEMGYYVDSPLTLDFEGVVFETTTHEAVEEMVTCVRIGPPARAHTATVPIGQFVAQNDAHLGSPSREVFVQPLDLARVHEAVVEMQFPLIR